MIGRFIVINVELKTLYSTKQTASRQTPF